MKNILVTFLFVFLFKFTSAQRQDLIGAWYSADSTQSTSLIFYPNNKILMRTGTKDNNHKSTFINGVFELKNNILTIKLDNNDTLQSQIQFLTDNSFQLYAYKGTERRKNMGKLIFRRVRDEEVR